LRRRGGRASGTSTLVGKPTNTLTLIHPGIPSDPARRRDPRAASGRALKQVIFVTEAQHTLNPGDYTMQLSGRFTDPFVDAKKDSRGRESATARRASTAARRKTKESDLGGQAEAEGRGAAAEQASPGQRLGSGGIAADEADRQDASWRHPVRASARTRSASPATHVPAAHAGS
jgi:hypothetical protein